MKQSQKPLPSHLEDFLDWLVRKRNLTLKTQANYARFLEKFFSWLGSNYLFSLRPHELTSDHLEKYRFFLVSDKHLKSSTQNIYLIALRSLLTYFVENNIFAPSPEKVHLLGSVLTKKPRFLSFQELRCLLEQPDVSMIRGLRDRVIMELLLATGLRISELVRLNRDFLSSDKISEDCHYWIGRYMAVRLDKNEALFVSWRNEKKQLSPKRLSVRTIQHFFKKYATEAGVPFAITPHILRHTQAQNLFTRSVDLKPLYRACGHSQMFSGEYVAPVGNIRSALRKNEFVWHDVEKRIQDEICWLREVISTFLREEKHAPDGCSHCFLRSIAILIVQGIISATEIRFDHTQVSFWKNPHTNSYPQEIYHGKDWHHRTMSQIEGHFIVQGYKVVRQPILQQGRADLGVSDFGGMDLFIEVGTVSLYKLIINFLSMDNFVYLIAPHEGVLVEFIKKKKK
ncbi:hypothetical protein A3A21_01475 [Candidatus Jorgensenbacteria bacterium RIFCSPLOWO2_01_FULL_45_25b]|uniref:Tyr recombinase domain-containing protein n=1 Tax=Candidatus Jorgensenbacteria bacterium RIFCSPLOWO2_01_FULL_45_25b TaxID=1798471 RepID=A0A1F6BT06_9BACT|nr:MAG: hypothetical protein A3A21_01475 [Candidatus Jorgensenbacteria bacterium RIFCSPLOWO2_01_FULL_45_25b]